MGKLEIFLLISGVLCWLSGIAEVQASKPEDPAYSVAVIEYSRSTNESPKENFDENIRGYRYLVREKLGPGKQGESVDIVVFPESTLNNISTEEYVPDPKDKQVLCDPNNRYPTLLEELSCWAGSNRKYIVANVVEKENCPEKEDENRPCSADKIMRYNTNVVFDRKGALIARYRKWNLYSEPMQNSTAEPEVISFETDFGVTFGVFTCFDILFKTPTQDLVEANVTDFVYPVYWYSELPFLTALQIQQGWSYANNVNLLVSGGSDPSTGTSGTGVFLGQMGALRSVMVSQPTTEMYILMVPKKNKEEIIKMDEPNVIAQPSNIPRRIKGYKMFREDTVDQFTTKLISNDSEVTENVCHGDLCCDFKIKRKTMETQGVFKYYSYRMVAFSGERKYLDGFKKSSSYKTCAVIACTDDKDLKNCARIFPDDVDVANYFYFENIEIHGNFKVNGKTLFLPSSVDQLFLPLGVKGFTFEETEGESGYKKVSMKLKEHNSDLLTFGIYALYYDGFSSGSRNASQIFILFLSFILIFIFKLYGSKPEDPAYSVAVIEYSRSTKASPKETLDENIRRYRDLVREKLGPGKQGESVDIVVFPESTLNNISTEEYVPNPKDKQVLCDPNNRYPTLLEELSCWAGSNRKYIVANVVEKENCPEKEDENRPCSSDKIMRYNTNVVFDRKGALIARYRKWNLYAEYMKNSTAEPEVISFETDFGVTFGVFTCFDILFKTPAHDLVEANVTDFVYPTYWYSELPFLTAIQIQQGWSYANNVNLLVSGGSNPATGTTGTGVFLGEMGALRSVMVSQPTIEMYILMVPKKNKDEIIKLDEPNVIAQPSNIPRRLKGLKMLREDTVDQFTTKLISNDSEVTENVCHGDLCCDFKIKRKTMETQGVFKYYSYRMVAFSGERKYLDGFKKSSYKTCAVIACTDDKDLKNCARIFPDDVDVANYFYFENIEIEGNFKVHAKTLFLPNSVDQLFLPLGVKGFSFEETDGESGYKKVSMKLKEHNSDLLTFGIYGLYYDGFSSGSRNASQFFILFLSFILIFIFKMY